MITKSLLLRIQKKNPDKSLKQIELVLRVHLNVLNSKLSISQKFNLTIPKLGKIHTHGNVKSLRVIGRRKTTNEYLAKEFLYSDKNLLF